MKPVIAVCIALVMAGSFSSCASSGATNTKLANKDNNKAKNLDEAERREALKEEVISKSTLLLGVLGTSGESGGELVDIFEGGTDAALDDAFGVEGGFVGSSGAGGGGMIATIRGGAPNSYVGMGDLAVDGEGTLEKKLVEVALEKLVDDLISCHQEQYYEDGELTAGVATLKISLDAFGKVEAVAFEDSDLAKPVTICIEERLEEMRFPAPAGGTVKIAQALTLSDEPIKDDEDAPEEEADDTDE